MAFELMRLCTHHVRLSLNHHHFEADGCPSAALQGKPRLKWNVGCLHLGDQRTIPMPTHDFRYGRILLKNSLA